MSVLFSTPRLTSSLALQYNFVFESVMGFEKAEKRILQLNKKRRNIKDNKVINGELDKYTFTIERRVTKRG
jgi:hypothetical protein